MTIKSHGMQCHGAIESELQGALRKVESLSEMPENSHHSHAVSGSLASSLSSQGSLNHPLKPSENGVVQLEDVKEVLSERDRHLCSINSLSRHVPSCVLEHIKAEGLRMLHDGFDDVRSHTGTFVSSGIGNEDDLSELSDISYSLLDLNDFPELVDCYEGKPVNDDSGGGVTAERKENSPIPFQGVWASGGAVVEGMESLRALEEQQEFDDEIPRVSSKDDNDTHGTPAQLSFSSGLSGDFLPKEECCKYFSPERHSLPKAIRYKCALLLVDISGFTKLSTTLDPERFSKAINNYFHLIVKIVETHGGDVLKFAGDALFAEWQESDDLALAQCAQVAIICGKEVVSQCSDYRVRDDNNNGAAILATLNVHCSLGVGELVGVHVGDHDVKREYIVLGDPIDQVSKALDFAALGEFAASPQALSVLSKTFNLHQTVLDAHAQQKPAVILRRGAQFFAMKSRATALSPTFVGEYDSMQQKNDFQCLSTEALRQCQKLLSLYVHSVVVAHDSGTSGMMNEKLVKKRHLEAAEIRTVYVMFIKPLVSAHLTGNVVADTRLLKLLNDIMNLVSGELARFSGHLRQFIVDDKGVILIGTFGLRGSTSPNMVAERALPATLAIYSALQNELGVKSRIGATIGKAYCGIIGGISRHEYAVLGPSVNLAARLVSSPTNSGILVDNSVRLLAHRSYGFNALPSVAAKGYNDLVPIYEPLSPLEKGWGKIPPNFVGRKEEVSKLVSMANQVATSGNRSRFVLVTGESGTGKRTMVSRAIEQMRKLWGRGRQRNIIVTKYKSKESDFLIPFSIFGPILQEVLPSNSSSPDEGTHESAAGSLSSPRRRHSTSESLSAMSTKSSDDESRPSVNRIGAICREINAPPEFIELLGNLVGISTATMSCGTSEAGRNLPSINGLVSYMVRIFKRFTDHIKLVVIAVADIHQIDDMSWKVLQELFDTAPNILFICTAPVLSHHNFRVDRNFWNYLNAECREEGSFASIQLNTLSRASVHTMALKTLSRSHFSSRLVDDIMRLSGGMPHFANEILESVKRQQESRQAVDDQIKELPSHGSIEELLVNRIDECDGNLRNVLNLCAVWGSSFYFEEIYEVYRRTENSDSDDVRQRLMESLEVGTSERILVTSHEGGELGEADLGDAACYNELGEVERRNAAPKPGTWLRYQRRCRGIKYTFCHEMWRSTILGMMLDERRRDLHKVIATTLGSHLENRTDDIESNLTLLGHWKASGESSQAVALALIIGKRFYRLGLHEQAVQLYKEVLAMWEDHSDKAETIGGLSKHLLSSVDAASLGFIIKLHIGLGQSLLASGRCDQSVSIYRNALEIFQTVESSKELEDRSVVFQIYSGHFTATHLRDVGRVVDGEYEKSVASGFVEETRKHGDPIHYLRALALQSEMYGRLGELDHALETVKVLSDAYSVEKQSQRLCHVYGSDKAAQCIALSSYWHSQNDSSVEAVQVCNYVAEQLLPKMERRNVDNSFLMLYPIIWVMKDNGMALESRKLFESFVVNAFEEFYGGGAGSSVWLPLFEPILMVLELSGKRGSHIDHLEQYMAWALDEDNLRFGKALSYTLSIMGKNPNAISAEICTLLGDRLVEGELKQKLVKIGATLAEEVEQSTALANGKSSDTSPSNL